MATANPQVKATAPQQSAPQAPTTEPDKTTDASTTSDDKVEEAAAKSLVEGKVAMMRAVHGYMVHPNQVPLTFDTDRVTKVVVDRWVVIQHEAGKLAVEA